MVQFRWTRQMFHLAFCMILLASSLPSYCIPPQHQKTKEKCELTETVCPIFDGTNGFVVENNGDDENQPTLRAAINKANSSKATPEEPFVIEFDLPQTGNSPNVIALTSELPAITKPVCINGFTNVGASEIKRILNVVICTDDPDIVIKGLVLEETACGSTMKGLNLLGFSFNDSNDENDGTALLVRASSCRIVGNNIGDTSDEIVGCLEDKTNRNGIVLQFGERVTIGGVCENERNIISRNGENGILIETDHNIVVGNYIGTEENGVIPRPNATGITVLGNNNTIGCNHLLGSNLISSNGIRGVIVEGAHNHILNTIIGLDHTGKRLLRNGLGIFLRGDYNCVSQSLVSGNGTNIAITGSHNAVKKNFIGTDCTGTIAFASNTGIALGLQAASTDRITDNVIEDNLIAVRDGGGITLVDTSSTLIQRNVIGSDITQSYSVGQQIGITFIGNPCFGILATSEQAEEESATRTRTISNCPLPCNCLEGFTAGGCCPVLPAADQAVYNVIKDNTILGNTVVGIGILGTARYTTIIGNRIGINKHGHFVPNSYGIILADFLSGPEDNIIQCNTIAGNRINGVALQGIAQFDEQVLLTQTVNNALIKNSIFCNGESAVSLTVNANCCLGAPLITEALECDKQLEVTIDVESLPDPPFLIEMYGNICCRKCISEGQFFLCSKTIEKPVDALKLRTPLRCPEIAFVSATVTQLSACLAPKNSSEYSCPVHIVRCIQEVSTDSSARIVQEIQITDL